MHEASELGKGLPPLSVGRVGQLGQLSCQGLELLAALWACTACRWDNEGTRES